MTVSLLLDKLLDAGSLPSDEDAALLTAWARMGGSLPINAAQARREAAAIRLALCMRMTERGLDC